MNVEILLYNFLSGLVEAFAAALFVQFLLDSRGLGLIELDKLTRESEALLANGLKAADW